MTQTLSNVRMVELLNTSLRSSHAQWKFLSTMTLEALVEIKRHSGILDTMAKHSDLLYLDA